MSQSFSVYLVGGAVRDALLKRPVKERDWVVVGANATDLLNLGYEQVGKDFPVFLHPQTKDEYALARTERKQGEGYTGFVCDASSSVTLEQDLLRRDLTVNALAQDDDGAIIDPYGGLADLDSKLLRHVSDAFVEDPLRVLRVARFAARYHYLGFTIAPETLTLMSTISANGELSTLTKERVWRETQKALSESSPHVFFDALIRCDALVSCFPSLTPLATLSQLSEVMENVAQQTATLSELERSAVQCAVISLGLTQYSAESATQWLDDLNAPNKVMQLAGTAVKLARFVCTNTLDAAGIVSLFNQLDVWRKEAVFITALDIVVMASALLDNQMPSDLKPQLLAMLAKAKEITAQTVMTSGVKGPQIRIAIDQKRTEHIGAALKLW